LTPEAETIQRLNRLAPLLSVEPDNLALHRECVELAIRGRELGRALELVDARLTLHPQEPESLFARTNVLIGLGRHDEALPILKRLEEQGVAPNAVMQNLATCHFAIGQHATARTYLDRLLAAGEKTPSVLYLAISTLHHLGEIEEAVKLADANATLAEAHGGLAGACALVYHDANDAAKADKYSRIALAQNPDSIDGLSVRGTLASHELEVPEALRCYSRILELMPNNGRAWLGLGLLSTLAQDFGKAREQLSRATELMPQHIGSWHALGWAHLFGGDAAGAEQHFAHALELDRNFAESHGAIAAMLALKGDREGAEREIEIAERLDRNGMTAHFARALLVERASGAAAGREFIQKRILALSTRLSGRPRALVSQLIDRAAK
jgi:tetratricopeptide (TPR) repeat protein